MYENVVMNCNFSCIFKEFNVKYFHLHQENNAKSHYTNCKSSRKQDRKIISERKMTIVAMRYFIICAFYIKKL
jgi:hypothetical protein